MASSDIPGPVLFVVPGDPDQKTGGYRYVRRMVDGLKDIGVDASVIGIEGDFPVPDAIAGAALDQLLSNAADDAVVVLDGLAMGGLPDVVASHAGRLRMIALVHHALADETGLPEKTRLWLFQAESRALEHTRGVITTSRHTARRLQDFKVKAAAIRTVEPGADTLAAQSSAGKQGKSPGSPINLLCVAHLSPRKAQHHLVEALSGLQDLHWHCTLAGSPDRDQSYSKQLREIIRSVGLENRVTLAGELDDEALARAYSAADLFVLPSVYEGYGMVIDEALAAGLPVITTDGGALAGTGQRPGIQQYPAGEVEQLKTCLQAWISNPRMLSAAAQEAQKQASAMRSWGTAAEEFREALLSLLPSADATAFDSDWLTLREPADHKARDRALMSEVASWAERGYSGPDAASGHQAPSLMVADLGAGTGSNARYIVPALKVPQRWVLLDQDDHLLALATQRLANLDVPLATHACHMTADSLAGQIPADTRLVTASALIDLMSARWLDALADAVAGLNAGLFIVLTYAGRFELAPAHSDDAWILQALNAHQHRDKGAGAAMGPDAVGYLREQLQSRGYQVSAAPSPWHLGADDSALQTALLEGWRAAVLEQVPEQRDRAAHWFRMRLEQVGQGQLSIRVDHQDLFARPRAEGDA